jgi:hypothetical protein
MVAMRVYEDFFENFFYNYYSRKEILDLGKKIKYE